MKKVFYIYWISYLFLIFINNIGLVLPLWTADVYKAAMHANLLYLPLHTLFKVWDRTDNPESIIKKLSSIDNIYLEAIIVSFVFRGMLYILSVWKLENRWDILAIFGAVQMAYFLFDVREKLKRIEKYIY